MSSKIDLSKIDMNNPAGWPLPIKSAACVFLGVLIIGVSWWMFVSDRRDILAAAEAKEQQLRGQFEDKQGRAANLEPLKQQLAQMELMLQQMLRQLPSKNEMPDLIVDISQTALAAGINNELFQPGAETAREFYAEKPIRLRMVGDYHQFGAFVSGVASLPRVVIMTMHNISLTPRRGSQLVLQGTVKTYRYLDEDEAAEVAAKGKKPAKKKAGGGK